MHQIKVTPELIKELQTFEEKKHVYMLEEDIEHENTVLDNHTKTFKYFFQHPNLRLLVVLAMMVLNFYLFMEDPIHSSITNSHVPIMGDIISFILSKYPSNAYSAVKVLLWLFAIIFGIIVGKIYIHHYLFCYKLELKIFSKDGQGSWMVIFLFTICVLYYEATIYNAILTLAGSHMDSYHLSNNMSIENKTFAHASCMVTWMGDFITMWVVLDTMLQEKKYHHWLNSVRKWWQEGYNRVIAFWIACMITIVFIIVATITDISNWQNINNGLVSTDELSRSFIASAVLILDFVIIIQDWDFPHFCGVIGIKLPGITTSELSFKIPQPFSVHNSLVNISGKWFNYGFLLVVILFDMIRWRNQIFYDPFDYGQYIDEKDMIYTVTDKAFINKANRTMLSYNYRWSTNRTMLSYNYRWSTNISNNSSTLMGQPDLKFYSKYHGYPMSLKGLAFIPPIVALLVFVYLINSFAKVESDHERTVRHWYESKFIKKRRRKVHPTVVEDSSDSDSDDEMEVIESQTANKFNYYFQHPACRLLVVCTNVVLTWLFIAEDPIGYSHAHADVRILGHAYSLVFGRYPSKIEFVAFKIFSWLCAILSAAFVGKYIIHHVVLMGIFKLKLFDKNQGTWILTFFSLFPFLYCWSLVYNEVIAINYSTSKYLQVTSKMNFKYKTFMKGLAMLSFFVHFTFALMVGDTILQENHYPSWATWLRKHWRGKYLRVIFFWIVTLTASMVACVAILADLISWDNMSSHSTASNELGRTSLAGFIIFFDLLIVMQDWQFPNFKSKSNTKLAGLPISNLKFKFLCMRYEIKGKWFTYGLIGLIMLIDSFNFHNQFTYQPVDYEQFTDTGHHIVSILNENLFMHGNVSILQQNQTGLYSGQNVMTAKVTYKAYTKAEKGVAFLPIILAILSFLGFGVKRTYEKKQAKNNRIYY